MNHRPIAAALTPAEQQRVNEVQKQLALGQGGVAALIEGLSDPSWSVRREAVTALSLLGQPAVDALCEVLRKRRDNEARIAAAVDALVASLSDVLGAVTALALEANPAVVADAAQVLGRRRNANGVRVLAPLVNHVDDNVAVAAIEALGRIGGPVAIEALISAVQSGNFFRVFPAIDVLGRCGDPRAIPPLAKLISNSMYQLEVARALGRTGESAAISPLLALLSHPSESVTRVAAMALADLHHRHLERYGNLEAPQQTLRRAQVDASAIARMARSLATASEEEQRALAQLFGALGGPDAIAGLCSLLDEPRAVSAVAAAALKRLGKEADQQARGALRSGDSARRQILLPIMSSVSAQAEISECLTDGDGLVRALACEALARVGAVEASGPLFELLADSNRRVVQAAGGAIQSLGSAQTKAMALRAATDPRPAIRRGALQVLSYFAFPEALPLFLETLRGDDVPAREIVMAGLALLEAPEAVEALLAQARDDNEKIRAAALRALGQCALRDDRIDACCLAALDDARAWVRYYACQALGRRQAHATCARLEALLHDDAGQVRVAAVEALSAFKLPQAQQALRRTAEGTDPDMQRAALIGLGLSRGPEALPVLLKAAADTDASTRLVALSALTESAADAALPALITAATDADENVASAALGFLAALPGVEATAALVALAAVPAERERVSPFLSVPGAARVAGLSAALATADDELASLVASALARLHTHEADEALLSAMGSPSTAVRKAAAASLASLRTPRAMEALVRAASSDPEPQVRQVCAVLVSV